MLFLGIETSCDETAVAVVEDGVAVKSNVISSSRKTFEALAGVIPEQAARMQIECMIPVLEQALKEAGVTMMDIDAIAVTKGPGLLGSLLVGTVTARALASIHQKPLIGVHHTLGHLSSTWLDGGLIIGNPETQNSQSATPSFPLLTLSASGGHTDLWYRTSHTHGELLGRTRDDAAGEAFDKGAALLGLPYPGGPSIQKAAEGGDVKKFDFPLPLHNEDTLDFSFSGLKTSLKYLLRDLALRQSSLRYDSGPSAGQATRNSNPATADIASSFQHAICKHLTDRLRLAIEQYSDVREVHLVGGVSANIHLRHLASGILEQSGVYPERQRRIRVPKHLSYCTDNGAMIAAAGFFLFQEIGEGAYSEFETQASMPLKETIRH